MRHHFNRQALCSHATPEGKGFMGEREKLHKKFNAGTITKEELWAYTLMLHSEKKTTFTVNGEVCFDVPKSDDSFKTIRIWGKDIKVSIEEYKTHCAIFNL